MSENNCWHIRLGNVGQYEADAIENGIVSISYGIARALEEIKGKERPDIRDIVKKYYPVANNHSIGKIASNVDRFVNEMNINDIVVCPMKTRNGYIKIGKIIGDCKKNKYKNEEELFSREVEWMNEELINKGVFGYDLRRSFSAHSPLFKLNHPKAYEEILETVDKYSKSQDEITDETIDETADEAAEELFDEFAEETLEPLLEESALIEIEKKIDSIFDPDSFEDLINEILKAKGYETYKTPKGPDGGIDIIFGSGDLGFDGPKVVVQVKFGKFSKDDAFYKLNNTVHTCNADYGLFVGWKPFNPNILREKSKEFFRIRLWDREKIMQELFDVYDKLPRDIQKKLQLKKIWIVEPSLDD